LIVGNGSAREQTTPTAIEADFDRGVVRYDPDTNKLSAGMTALGRAGLRNDIGPMIGLLGRTETPGVNAHVSKCPTIKASKLTVPAGCSQTSAHQPLETCHPKCRSSIRSSRALVFSKRLAQALMRRP
jgi:hypothetical protein